MIPSMRLRETRDIVARAIEAFKLVAMDPVQRGPGDPLVRVVNTHLARKALRELTTVSLGANIANQVRSLIVEPIITAQESVSSHEPTASALVSRLRALSTSLTQAMEIIDGVAPPTGGAQVLVKLPPEESLLATAAVLKDLDTAFNLLLARLNEPPLKVEGVDTGSVWMVLSAGTAAALNVVARTVEALGKLVDAIAHYRKQMAFIRSLDADTEIRKQQEALNQRMQEQLVESLARQLAASPTGEPPRAPDQELVRTYVLSLQTLQELSNRGAEIRLIAAAQGTGGAKETAAIGERAAPAALPPGGDPPQGT